MEFPSLSDLLRLLRMRDTRPSILPRDSRGASRRKEDRGLQLRSLLTPRDNKRARHQMCRLGVTAVSHL